MAEAIAAAITLEPEPQAEELEAADLVSTRAIKAELSKFLQRFGVPVTGDGRRNARRDVLRARSVFVARAIKVGLDVRISRQTIPKEIAEEAAAAEHRTLEWFEEHAGEVLGDPVRPSKGGVPIFINRKSKSNARKKLEDEVSISKVTSYLEVCRTRQGRPAPAAGRPNENEERPPTTLQLRTYLRSQNLTVAGNAQELLSRARAPTDGDRARAVREEAPETQESLKAAITGVMCAGYLKENGIEPGEGKLQKVERAILVAKAKVITRADDPSLPYQIRRFMELSDLSAVDPVACESQFHELKRAHPLVPSRVRRRHKAAGDTSNQENFTSVSSFGPVEGLASATQYPKRKPGRPLGTRYIPPKPSADEARAYAHNSDLSNKRLNSLLQRAATEGGRLRGHGGLLLIRYRKDRKGQYHVHVLAEKKNEILTGAACLALRAIDEKKSHGRLPVNVASLQIDEPEDVFRRKRARTAQLPCDVGEA